MKIATLDEDKASQPNRKKIHELSTEELNHYPISENCQFQDTVWTLTNRTPGAKGNSSTLDWSMTLFDGSKLTDDQHVVRLRWAKILLLSLLFQPADGRRIAPGYLGGFKRQLRFLLSWMSEAGYYLPNELTPAVLEGYLDQLPSCLIAHSHSEEIGVSTAALSLMALTHLWNQRQAMLRMGVMPLPRHPFAGRSATTIARSLATKAKGWIKPLPDEVAIPFLNKAAWLLGAPADDVIRLLDVVRDPIVSEKDKIPHEATFRDKAKLSRTMDFLESFKFATLDGESAPWHPPLSEAYEQSSEFRAARILRVRELWEAVRDAAMITVQATSGMRLSELLGIVAGMDEATGLPKCLRLEKSATGLFEWFVLRSQLSKAEEGLAREVDWVLGMRPIGSDEIPLAVRALQVLNSLHDPWRANAKTDRLLLSGHPGCTLPLPTLRRGAMNVDTANVAMQRFIDRWVDLSGLPDTSARRTEDNDLLPWREQKGKAFRTHMLRKTWAQFALACDSRLLPAIQMQFHHINLAMTESGYIGSNPLLLSELDSVSTQKTNLTVFEIVIGKEKVAGRMGEQLERALETLRLNAGTLSTSAKWREAVQWTELNQLKMFFSPHATCCPTRTSEMRCHDASNTPVLLRKAPNTATREPSLCAGCACAIMDKSHEPFWSDRYLGCEVSVRQAEKSGLQPGTFREIRLRADQARLILRKFGTDLDELDARINSIVESEHAKNEKDRPTRRSH